MFKNIWTPLFFEHFRKTKWSSMSKKCWGRLQGHFGQCPKLSRFFIWMTSLTAVTVTCISFIGFRDIVLSSYFVGSLGSSKCARAASPGYCHLLGGHRMTGGWRTQRRRRRRRRGWKRMPPCVVASQDSVIVITQDTALSEH